MQRLSAAAAEGHGEQMGRHDPGQPKQSSSGGAQQQDVNLRPGPSHEELQHIYKDAIPFRVAEQRMSALIQSLLVVACCGITPVLRFIPSAVLWGAPLPLEGCMSGAMP